MTEVRLLANTVVGLGFSRRGFEAALERRPSMIGCDAGSSDFGPYYLGSGTTPKSPQAFRRDLEIMLEGARRLDVPLVVGSCGGAGADVHVDVFANLIKEIAAEKGLHFRLATISSEQSRERLIRAVDDGRVHPHGPVKDLTVEEIDATGRVVAMMGTEPVAAALDGGADVILTGRIVDPAIFAPVALRAGVDPGTAWHAAKTIDKGALATTDPSKGSPVLASIDDHGFVVEPFVPDVACTVATVASVVMHENPDPFHVTEPGGRIDTTDAVYRQLDQHRVGVTGSRFVPAPYTVKLEGAALDGYRSILIAGIRDPRVIERFDEFLEVYRDKLIRVAASLAIHESEFSVGFRSYGKDAVMGARELPDLPVPHEIGLIVDVVGATEAIARAVAGKAGPVGSRLDIIGGASGGGNFAYPFSPSVVYVGPVYRWSVWHTMEIEPDEIADLFPITYEDL
jgi:hypothetical protein